MSSLPDRKRSNLIRPSRVLVASAARIAAAAAWRLTHPRLREPYVESKAPAALQRLYYEASDGWRSPIYIMPHLPGHAGEPLVLVGGLGFGPDLLRYGGENSLAQRLLRAGYQVYLLAHRGNRGAVPPMAGGQTVNFDQILERDIGPALERIQEHSGARRVLWVGAGLGGQLGLAYSAGQQGAQIAALAAVQAPVLFSKAHTGLQRRKVLSRLIPGHWRLPTHSVARLLATAVGEQPWCEAFFGAGLSMPRVRGALEYTSEDVSAGLVSQVLDWIDHERLVSQGGLFDYVESLKNGDVPLLVAQEAKALPMSALDYWGSSDRDFVELESGVSSLSALLGDEAMDKLVGPLISWLDGRRSLCWNDPDTEEVVHLAG